MTKYEAQSRLPLMVKLTYPYEKYGTLELDEDGGVCYAWYICEDGDKLFNTQADNWRDVVLILTEFLKNNNFKK